MQQTLREESIGENTKMVENAKEISKSHHDSEIIPCEVFERRADYSQRNQPLLMEFLECKKESESFQTDCTKNEL